MNTNIRQLIEAEIFSRAAKLLIDAGYECRLYNGEEFCTPRTTDLRTLECEIMSKDEDILYVYKDGKQSGHIHFIYGNDGYDVIADYTLNIEETLAPVNAYAESLQNE